MNRVGLLMKKVGCTSLYTEENVPMPITLLKLEDNVVLSTEKREGFTIVKISFGSLKNVNKPQKKYFEKLGVEKMGRISEFRLTGNSDIKSLSSFSVEHFHNGQFVDIMGTSIGKGFAGVMKRHNFSGGSASHGNSFAHRSGGSTGQCQDPGRTFKGKKMPGQLGNKKVTVQNLKVQMIYPEDKLIAIKGSVPGCKNSYVMVKDSLKKLINL